MTNRDFYNAIAEGQVTDEIKTFAAEKIAKLNADAEKRKAKVSEENTAFYAELGEKIINSVEVGKAYSAKEIASLIEEKAGKVVYALRGLADTGRIEKFKEKKSDSYSYRYNG